MLYHYYSRPSRVSRFFAAFLGLLLLFMAFLQWGVPWGNRLRWWTWHPHVPSSVFVVLGVLMAGSAVLTEVTHDGWPRGREWWHPKVK